MERKQFQTSETGAGRSWNRPLNAAVLKYIAAADMAVDHAAVALLYVPVIQPNLPLVHGNRIWQIYQIYRVLRQIGRIAFPIFCFFIVEGFLHTRSRARYALRLFLFGLLSEIPFDLALRGKLIQLDHQNVMFEFLFAIAMLSVWDWCDRRKHLPGTASQSESADDRLPETAGATGTESGEASAQKTAEKENPVRNAAYTLLQFGAAAGIAYLAELCCLDYGWKGIALILLIYLLRFSRPIQCAAGALAMSLWEPPAILSFFPLLFLYNGKRGSQLKWFFYCFYPGHLMLLWALSHLI